MRSLLNWDTAHWSLKAAAMAFARTVKQYYFNNILDSNSNYDLLCLIIVYLEKQIQSLEYLAFEVDAEYL